jgi:carboxyl-terminal processing protease
MSRRITTLVCLAAMLAACGGGGGGGSAPPPTGGGGTPTPTPTPTPTGGCSLRERQDWVAGQLREWYLFPELLVTGLNPASYSTVEAYIDALTANARSQGKDRHFTYLTSIAQENAFFQSGDSAGFGIRIAVDTSARRLFVNEAFEGAPALAAGMDRGTEILAIGTSAADLKTVDSIISSGGSAGIDNALGPPTAGLTRYFRANIGGTVKEFSVTKAKFSITPVSSRYGVKVLTDGGEKIGYVNLRTFIEPADPALRNAFSSLKSQGVTKVIVDLRYNGGGLVSIAELMANLMGANRTTSNVLDYTIFNSSKSSNNKTAHFNPQSQSVAPVKLAFIGTGGTASASELVINTFIPYFGASSALIGSNTYGKPVGQIGVDKSACDDRLRVMAFKVQNANHQGDYFNGLAATMGATCQAADDIMKPMGDPGEASTKAGLDFLAGRTCNPIGGIGIASAEAPKRRDLVQGSRPSAAQREVPGFY